MRAGTPERQEISLEARQELLLARNVNMFAVEELDGRAGWNDHAAFINQLSMDGKTPLGWPVGDVNGQHAVLVVRAASEDDARAMFTDDPWTDSILRIESVERWTLWIGADIRPPRPERLVAEPHPRQPAPASTPVLFPSWGLRTAI